MSKIEDLIKQYCPDGVERKKLGDVCSICTDYTAAGSFAAIAKNVQYLSEENYALLVRTMDIKSKFSKGNPIYVDKHAFEYLWRVQLSVDSIILPNIGNCGEVYYLKPQDIPYKNAVLAPNAILLRSENCNMRFLYYILQSSAFQWALHRITTPGGQTKFNKTDLKKLEIPVPSRPVQDEIVRILDKFTELEKELEKELELRRKQHEFYRDKLLTFDGGGVEYKKLGELGTFYGGITGKSKADFENGNAKFISYKNVYSNFAVDQRTFDRVMIKENENQRSLQYGDICFTGSSETPDECGFSSVVTSVPSEPLYLNSFSFFFRFHDLSGINPEYMKYLFRSSDLRYQIGKTANGVTRFNVSKELMKSVIIPIPSPTEQERIVKILDKFDTLTTSLTSGLPAEIKLRKQQYEYYRDYLFGLLN